MRPVAISAPSFAARSAAVAWSASGRSRPFTSRSRSRARSSSDETRASFDSARTRRRWYLPSPAASSTNRRRSCGFESRISSTLPWPITECISRPRPVSERSSRTSRRRTRARFTRYSLSPPRSSRRMTETSLNSRGSVPHSLSSTSSTSQTPAGGRPSDPAKSTSCPVGARSWTGEETAIAHWSASAMLDLPDPLGPTTTAMPWSKHSSTLPGNDLKPRIRSAFRYIGLAFVELRRLRLPERLERLPGRALLRCLLARAGAATELVAHPPSRPTCTHAGEAGPRSRQRHTLPTGPDVRVPPGARSCSRRARRGRSPPVRRTPRRPHRPPARTRARRSSRRSPPRPGPRGRPATR